MPSIAQRVADNVALGPQPLAPDATFRPDVSPPPVSRAPFPVRGLPPVGLVLDSDLAYVAVGDNSQFLRSRVFVPGTPPWLVRNTTQGGMGQRAAQVIQAQTGTSNFLLTKGGLSVGKNAPQNGLINVGLVSAIGPNGQVNPASAAVASVGGRVNSWSGQLTFVPSATSIAWYWDGTNGSSPIIIYRDDQTSIGPISNSMTVTGLAATTTYYFYAYYDEILKGIAFVGSQAGSNGTAWPSATALKAFQQAGLANRIAIGLGMAATTGGSSGGGGGSGGNNGGRPLK